jgi:phage shock protein C
MQPRLTRSTNETMVAGVCGGLAEYFSIDPVIVRLIFVLVTLTSGMGLPVYILLWLIMPRQNTLAGQSGQLFSQGGLSAEDEAAQFGMGATQSREVLRSRQQAGQARTQTGGFGVMTDPAPEYRFDPQTGQPLGPGETTGQTINLGDPASDLPVAAPPRKARNWRTLGLILIGIGGLIFLEQIGIDLSLMFPALLIVAGVILLRRKR